MRCDISRWMMSILCSFVVISFCATLAPLTKQYYDLDAVALNAGYLISKRGGINDEVREFVKNECDGIIESVGVEEDFAPIGSLFTFKITKHNTAVVNYFKNTISVTRSVILGK